MLSEPESSFNISEPLPHLSLHDANKIEERAVRDANEEYEAVGIDVTAEAQCIFDFFANMYVLDHHLHDSYSHKCFWKHKVISIPLLGIEIHPPYTSASDVVNVNDQGSKDAVNRIIRQLEQARSKLPTL